MLPQLIPLELHHIRLLNMVRMRKYAQLHHHWEKIPTEIMSNLILVYSVMLNEAIIKVISFWQQGVGVGSAVKQTWVSLKSKIQAVPVVAAPQPAVSWGSTVARAWGCYWVPQYNWVPQS